MYKTPKQRFSTPFKTPQQNHNVPFISQHSTPGFDARDILSNLSQTSSHQSASLGRDTSDISEGMNVRNVALEESGYQSFQDSLVINSLHKQKQHENVKKNWNFKATDKRKRQEKQTEESIKAQRNESLTRENVEAQTKFSTLKEKSPGRPKRTPCYTPKSNTIDKLVKKFSRPKRHSTPKRKFHFHKEQPVLDCSPIRPDTPMMNNAYDFEISPDSEVKMQNKRKKIKAKKEVLKVITKMHKEILWWQQYRKDYRERQLISGEGSQCSGPEAIKVKVSCSNMDLNENYTVQPGTSLLDDDSQVGLLEAYRPKVL